MNDKFTNDMDEITDLLNQTAETTNPNPHFAAELERSLTQAHNEKSKPGWFHFTRKQIFTTLAWTASLVAFTFFMNWAVSTVAPVPTSMPAAYDTSAPPTVEKPAINNEIQGTPVPDTSGYDWRGTKLYLNAPLPDVPTEANIYLLKEDQQATVESARALAEQLGIQGEVYIRGLYPAETGYFITDGKQSLTVNSNLYFTYTADMAKAYNNAGATANSNAETIINDFLQTHGFDFPHKVEKAELYGGYVVVPLSPDGFSMRYEFFSSRPMRVTLDDNGQVLQLESNLMDYESFSAQTYNIITAEEAFQKLMDDTIPAGKIESAIFSSIAGIKEWRYTYPSNETITIYGYAYSIPALDSARPPFVQIDGYTATGNTNGMDALQPNTFIEATGQFVTENGIERFNIESWKPSEFPQDGIVGTLRRENGQVLLQTEQGEELTIQPDIPADLPLPFENAFIVGIRKGNIYEWTLIDDRMSGGGGGGGGGGGLGFYKLNLSGTPVPFPTATPTPASGEGNYTVRQGDTLTSIAQAHGITVDELMQANGMTDSLIFLDQQLIIPGAESVQSDVGQRIEGQRGLMNITIYSKPDGNQRVEYLFTYMPENAPYPYMMILEGDNLQELQAYQNRPVEIWGTVDRYDERYGLPVVTIEQFEIPFPDLQFQILRGTTQTIDINGQSSLLFTTEDGDDYILVAPAGYIETSHSDSGGDNTNNLEIVEGLVIPDETVGGYPTLRIFSSAMAISPKNGQPIELTVTADQIYTYDEVIDTSETYVPPTLTIEKVELMYYVTNPHWQVDHLDGSPLYIQPVWRFYGHYETGGEFEVIVQALKQEYLLPQLDPYIQGG